MKYCNKCVMPDTRPGLTFDQYGVCSACRNYSNRKNVDYAKRFEELKALCNRFRNINGPNGYDCMIAVSGGKDSHFQVFVIKELMNMNPLLVSVEDNFPMTKAGSHNIKNISEEFGCDIISIKPNLRAQKKVMRYTFEQYGKPTYLTDRYIYTYPLHMAVKFNTPLLIYGENVSYEYGGNDCEETYSAREQINNGVAAGITKEELLSEGVSPSDLNFFDSPAKEDLDRLEPIYLSYFVEWNSVNNYELAKKRGFRDLTHEWNRTNHVECYDQIDSRGYLVHPWLKYPKFGHAFATDFSSRLVRYGCVSRDEAIKLVEDHDAFIDPLAVHDFCELLGYSISEFWSIVDRFYNKDLFEKDQYGIWRLKRAISDA